MLNSFKHCPYLYDVPIMLKMREISCAITRLNPATCVYACMCDSKCTCVSLLHLSIVKPSHY